ncbi:Rieske 2Fe-2S domain-containing protein [bacterium]|nr:Rieske 2Fe-2S domain-containing protein [bacterium]
MLRLCHIDDIPDEASKGFQLDGLALFAVKKAGAVYVYKNQCPHLGVQLEWLDDQFLDSEQALIQCATHGALFIIESGLCVSGPCLGEQLQTVRHEIKDGNILVDLTSLERQEQDSF